MAPAMPPTAAPGVDAVNPLPSMPAASETISEIHKHTQLMTAAQILHPILQVRLQHLPPKLSICGMAPGIEPTGKPAIPG
jgi:hypothetical protein